MNIADMTDREYIDNNIAEFPFVRTGMSPEEYDEERRYFMQHYKDYYNGSGKYVPLWKQREKT